MEILVYSVSFCPLKSISNSFKFAHSIFLGIFFLGMGHRPGSQGGVTGQGVRDGSQARESAIGHRPGS